MEAGAAALLGHVSHLAGRGGARVGGSEPAAVRFRVPDGRRSGFDDSVRGDMTFDTDVIGDPVILRSDGLPAYNFAVVMTTRSWRHARDPRRRSHLEHAAADPDLRGAGLRRPRCSRTSRWSSARITARCRSAMAPPRSRSSARGLSARSAGQLSGADRLVARRRRDSLPSTCCSSGFAVCRRSCAGVFDEEKLAWVNRHYLRAADPRGLRHSRSHFCQRRDRMAVAVGRGFASRDGAVRRVGRSARSGARRLRFLFEYDPRATLALPGVATSARAGSTP